MVGKFFRMNKIVVSDFFLDVGIGRRCFGDKMIVVKVLYLFGKGVKFFLVVYSKFFNLVRFFVKVEEEKDYD